MRQEHGLDDEHQARQWPGSGATDYPSAPEPPEGAAGWHELLLALSGRIADDVVSAARAMPEGTDDTARAAVVVAGVRQAGAQMTSDELLALVQALLQVAEPGDTVNVARMLDAHGDLPLLPYHFSPLRPDTDAVQAGRDSDGIDPDGEPVPADLSGDDRRTWRDPVALEAVSAARAESGAAGTGVVGLWGAWRYPAGAFAPAADEGVRVFMVETAAQASQQQITRRFQQRLAQVGETSPRIEVFGPLTRLAPYQRSVLAGGTLLWTPGSEREPQVVPVFDGVDADGAPRFAPEHPHLAAGERSKVAAYLYGAEMLMITTATMLDVVEPQRGDVVPLSFHTDGHYVWPEAAGYYVDQHGLAPHPPLLAAIRSARYLPPAVDEVALFRAETALFETDDDE